MRKLSIRYPAHHRLQYSLIFLVFIQILAIGAITISTIAAHQRNHVMVKKIISPKANEQKINTKESDIISKSFPASFTARIYYVNYVAGFILLLTLLIFAFLVNRHIIKPISELTYKARRVAKGVYQVSKKIEGQSELASLGTTFDNMVKKIAIQE